MVFRKERIGNSTTIPLTNCFLHSPGIELAKSSFIRDSIMIPAMKTDECTKRNLKMNYIVAFMVMVTA